GRSVSALRITTSPSKPFLRRPKAAASPPLPPPTITTRFLATVLHPPVKAIPWRVTQPAGMELEEEPWQPPRRSVRDVHATLARGPRHGRGRAQPEKQPDAGDLAQAVRIGCSHPRGSGAEPR